MREMTESYDERSRREKAPIQYKVYKGMKGTAGALRLSLKRPYTNSDLKKTEGILFLEMAPTTGPNNYDWERQKITMALGITDISKIILYLKSPGHPQFVRTDGKLKILHDKGAGTADRGKDTKSLEISKSETTTNFLFNLWQKSESGNINVSVPISPDEAITLSVLLQTSIPLILNWTEGPN